MSKSSHVHTIRLPLRKICSALPAVALISGAIMVPASAAQGVAANVGAASKSSPTIVGPDIAMTMPGSAQIEADPFPMPPPKGRVPKTATPSLQPLASMLPAGTVPGSSSLVTLDSTGIPVRALDAYRKAASLVGSADPGCHLDWALLAAIGRVESNHARFGGNQLDASGTARPGIIGIALDGSDGTARILDTDHGLLDRDTVYDRAVGPMQFLPSTWRNAGVDANGDGVKDPQNMADAAAADAVFLCSGKGDLRRPDDLRSAILRYNASDSYAAMVTAIADAYRLGVTALPASDLTLAPSPAAVASSTPNPATKPVNPPPAKPASGQPSLTSPSATGHQPALTPLPSATITPTSQPASTQPSTTQPAPTSAQLPSSPTCVPTSTTTSSASPTSAQTCPPTPTPCVPTSTATSSASPTSAQTCPPTPCVPTSTATSSASPTSAQTCPPTPCVPPSTATSSASPTSAQTCPPTPCVPTSTATSSASPTSAQTCPPTPCVPTSTATSSASPTSAQTCPPPPCVPTSTATSSASPTSAQTCPPTPCVPTSTATSSASPTSAQT